MILLRSNVIVCALLFLNLYPVSGPDRQKFFAYFFSNIAVDLYDQYQLFNLLHILIILTKEKALELLLMFCYPSPGRCLKTG